METLFYMVIVALPCCGMIWWTDRQWKREKRAHNKSKDLLLTYALNFGVLDGINPGAPKRFCHNQFVTLKHNGQKGMIRHIEAWDKQDCYWWYYVDTIPYGGQSCMFWPEKDIEEWK